MKRLGFLILITAVTTAMSAGASWAGQDTAAPRKLVAPVRGEANVEITKPDTKVIGNDVVTIIRVKNVAKAPIAGFKIEENWYTKAGDAMGGDVYRHPRPLQVGEIIQITLKTPRSRVVGRTNQVTSSPTPTALSSRPR